MASTLDQQIQQFRARSYMAMPISGLLCWLALFVVCYGFEDKLIVQVWAYFILTSFTLPVGLLISKLVKQPMVMDVKNNLFDRIFISSVISVVPVFIIAISFFKVLPQSLPLSLGILTGLMWIVFSVLHGSVVGYAHAIVRFSLVPLAWFLIPQNQFSSVALAVVVSYLVSIVLLLNKKHAMKDIK